VRIGGSEIDSELKKDFQNFCVAILWCLEMKNTLQMLTFMLKF
jgi:hypothetical protein